MESYISSKLSVSGDELDVLLRLGGDSDGVRDAARDDVFDEEYLCDSG